MYENLCSFDHRVALVTGAAGNIGFAVCRRLAAHGVRIAACDLRSESVAARMAPLVADGADIRAYAMDVTDRGSVRAAVAAATADFGKLDILVNNAGVWEHRDVQGRQRFEEPSYLDAFTLGGPVGFSCDLTAFSEPDLKRLSDVLSERRKDASFWNRSVGRILCDTPSLVAFQYDDGTLDDVRVVVVSDNLRQSRTTVHPILAAGVDYRVDGKIRTAGDLAANGLGVALSSFRGTVLRLTAVREQQEGRQQ